MKRKPIFGKILENLNTLIHTKGIVRKTRSHFDHTPFEAMFREVTEEQYRGEYALEH